MENEHMHDTHEPALHPHMVHTAGEKHAGAVMQHQPSPKPRRLVLRYVVIVILVLFFAGILGYVAGGGSLVPKQEQKFYAVFLTNGQVFFGTIAQEDRENLVLDNVFYLQLVNQPATGDTAQPQSQTKLVKKGEEPYGPKNSIRINRQQVSVIEELRSDSQVLQEIQGLLKT